jgi:hypothetical protein
MGSPMMANYLMQGMVTVGTIVVFQSHPYRRGEAR